MEFRYRPNVAAILQKDAGEILICERMDVAGAWQFPQGGIDPGESPEVALARELREELSLERSDWELLARKGAYRYLLGPGRTKKGFHGQEQEYFLLRLLSPESRIRVEGEHQEFRRTQWIQPEEFRLEWLPPMKQDVYQAVFRDFFGIDLRRYIETD